jgi:hypothetical protein
MDMVSTIFIQANLQHNTAASRVLARKVSIKEIDKALIHDPCYREDRIIGLNISGYILYSAGGTDRPRSYILARNMTVWVLSGFSCRNLVAVLVKYTEDGEEGLLIVFRLSAI